VGRQAVDGDGLREFLGSRGVGDWTTDAPSPAETLCEVAGRVCYESFRNPRPGGNGAYLDHILESRHGNIAEHAVFNFIVSGVSRSLTHELIRHRAGVSVSQLSQRYVDSDDVAFVVPPALEAAVRAADEWEGDFPQGPKIEAGMDWIRGMQECRDRYERLGNHLIEALSHKPIRTARIKAAREAARSVLPSATETVVFVTANARALRHVWEQRGSIHADAEIRRLAIEWVRVTKPAAPNLFGDVSIIPTDDGIGRIEIAYSKV
jgi:thymidylate synthase (FAD)